MPKFLVIAAIICIAMVILGINRGFDVSDEGLYVLLAHPLQENQGGIFNYDLFFKLFHQITGIHFGIVGLRILRLFIYCLGALALAVFYRNLKGEKRLSLEVYLISLLGLMAGYGFLPASLSYNHLSVVLAAGCLALLSTGTPKLTQNLSLGLLLGILVYVKVTTALLLGLISLGLMLYEKRLNWKVLFALLIPFILLEGVFYLTLSENAIIRLSDGLSIQTGREDYHWWTLVKHTGVGAFWSLLLFVISFLSFRLIKKKFFQALLIISAFHLTFFITHITDEWNHFFLLLGVVVWAWFFAKSDFSRFSAKEKVWILLLLVLPFVLHFGSNVYWLRIGIHYLVFWIIAWLILAEKARLKSFKWVNIGISFSALLLVFNGLWWHSFEQNELWKNTEKWEYLPGKTIHLSSHQVSTLQKLKTQIGEEKELLAAYRNSGIPFLLGKTLPQSPGYWDKEQLKGFFPKGYSKDVLFSPIDSLPQNFTQEPILITDFR
ncbi:hypothetical protein [Algoriphagus formosus]|uniref:hypothetical protein n=1 Tax=Algoriphagus formosus TaxID=2007308 RepID=UPI000C29503F|nr:hypothetical protein [Algoriphagus formosus]